MGRHLFWIDEFRALPPGWSSSFGANLLFNATPRTDAAGNGGGYSISNNLNTAGGVGSPDLDPINEFWVHGGIDIAGNTGAGARPAFLWSGSGGIAGRVIFKNASNVLEILRGSTSVATGVALPTGRYLTFLIHVYQANSGGRVRVWIDKTAAATPDLEFNGDTKESTYLAESFSINDFHLTDWDDIVINTMTVAYDTGVGGVAVAGETLTGATSGATAVVTSVKSGNATAGVLYLENWNGTDFQDNEQITTGGTFDADVNAPTADYVSGMEPNSLEPGNEFVMLAVPNGVGNSTQCDMTGSGAQATGVWTLAGQPNDGDQTEIDGKTYTFEATLTNVDGNVHIGASASATIDNLIAAIELGAGAGTDYATAMTIHPTCTGAAGAGDTMDCTANYYGTFGNSISTTDPTDVSGNLSWGGATLSGGTGENYEGVDSVPTGSSIHVETDTAGERDTYKVNMTSVLPAASEIGSITCVQLSMFAFSDLGGITNIQGVVRQTSTDYDSSNFSLPSTVTLANDIRDTQPDGSGGWDRAALVDPAFEVGFEFVA